MIAAAHPSRLWEDFSRLGLLTFAFGYVGALALANTGLGILLIAFLGRNSHPQAVDVLIL